MDGQLAEQRRNIGVLAVTSEDRLHADWTAAQQARSDGHKNAESHAEKLLENVPRHAMMSAVIDGHPATLSLAWRG